jgi:hypothetical protein
MRQPRWRRLAIGRSKLLDDCDLLRPQLARRSAYYVARARPDGRYQRTDDETVLQQIRAVTNRRATYGYRRVGPW